MGPTAIRLVMGIGAAIALITACSAQHLPSTESAGETSGLIVAHPFTAIKYARRVRVLPDGKWQFIRNERYPVRIARDTNGRLMMQMVDSDELDPDCDHLDLRVPPPCPAWGVVVIDPVSHLVTHWPEGEYAAHIAIDFPLTPERLNEAIEDTSNLPAIGPEFSDEDGHVSKADLGDKDIDGIGAHGIRWTLLYEGNRNGSVVPRTRIFEVWTSAEMQLMVRVVDGDPQGEEVVWGLEKISLQPDPELFQPPAGYQMQHGPRAGNQTRNADSDKYLNGDFEYLKSWFER